MMLNGDDNHNSTSNGHTDGLALVGEAGSPVGHGSNAKHSNPQGQPPECQAQQQFQTDFSKPPYLRQRNDSALEEMVHGKRCSEGHAPAQLPDLGPLRRHAYYGGLAPEVIGTPLWDAKYWSDSVCPSVHTCCLKLLTTYAPSPSVTHTYLQDCYHCLLLQRSQTLSYMRIHSNMRIHSASASLKRTSHLSCILAPAHSVLALRSASVSRFVAATAGYPAVRDGPDLRAAILGHGPVAAGAAVWVGLLAHEPRLLARHVHHVRAAPAHHAAGTSGPNTIH